jgi:cytidylate kinase
MAQHPRLRAALVRLQRQLAGMAHLVVEGRDTGSVVFPHAPYKFFLTADAFVRARRRQMELAQLQGRAPSVSVIATQLRERDQRDRGRSSGPLVRPPGAFVVDTSHMKATAVVQRMLQHLYKFCSA